MTASVLSVITLGTHPDHYGSWILWVWYLLVLSKCLVPVLVEQVRILRTFLTVFLRRSRTFGRVLAGSVLSVYTYSICARGTTRVHGSYPGASTYPVRYGFMVFLYFLARSRSSEHVLEMSCFSGCSGIRAWATGTSLGISRLVPV